MLQAKIQIHQTSVSDENDFKGGFTIYWHGGHLGHVT